MLVHTYTVCSLATHSLPYCLGRVWYFLLSQLEMINEHAQKLKMIHSICFLVLVQSIELIGELNHVTRGVVLIGYSTWGQPEVGPATRPFPGLGQVGLHRRFIVFEDRCNGYSYPVVLCLKLLIVQLSVQKLVCQLDSVKSGIGVCMDWQHCCISLPIELTSSLLKCSGDASFGFIVCIETVFQFMCVLIVFVEP